MVAQENDAERAVRAAPSIQRALAELNRRNEDAKPVTAPLGIEIASQRHDRRGGADRQVVLHPALGRDPDFKFVDLAF
jgi:hypothetical protein